MKNCYIAILLMFKAVSPFNFDILIFSYFLKSEVLSATLQANCTQSSLANILQSGLLTIRIVSFKNSDESYVAYSLVVTKVDSGILITYK